MIRSAVTMTSLSFILPMTVLPVIISPANAQDGPLNRVVQEIVQCRNLADPEVRLACFDAATELLPGTSGIPDIASSSTLSSDGQTATASDPSSSERESASQHAAAEHPGGREMPSGQPRPSDRRPTEEPARQDSQPDSALPEWASAPEQDQGQSSGSEQDRFSAVVVRITRNNVGRHTFYTEDGAVWEQTQLEEVRYPDSLPAKAEFRKRLIGSPTIEFENAIRHYRVKRIR